MMWFVYIIDIVLCVPQGRSSESVSYNSYSYRNSRETEQMYNLINCWRESSIKGIGRGAAVMAIRRHPVREASVEHSKWGRI